MTCTTSLFGTLALSQSLPRSSRSEQSKRRLLSASLANKLDRVNVLNGHTGCVNALSWARNGEVLLSGGDDTTVRMWRIDPTDTETAYPLICQSVIHTGHTANIFNAQMLPYSSRIATAAGDSQVRVFDVGDASTGITSDAGQFFEPDACLRVLRCHSNRVKRIVTEESPDLFLSISEDGTVRQHDLRTAHNCTQGGGGCPAPLVKLPLQLTTLSLSPLTPYQFVVAGYAPYGYLFDRRHVGRYLEEEWGIAPDIEQATTCVRRLGRKARAPGERKGREHITGSRISPANGHEVLLSYSGDGIYLYSTMDEPEAWPPPQESSILTPNSKESSPQESTRATSEVEENTHEESTIATPEPNTQTSNDEEAMAVDESEDGDTTPDQTDSPEPDETSEERVHSSVPVIMPRSRYAGICNIRTVKDVNFLGPNDEYIVSGSDDGNWFMWEKKSGILHDILEGDGTVVNVIEGHPHLPLAAVSGIDHTVKLFAPTQGQSAFSRMDHSASIIQQNTETSRQRRPVTLDFTRLLLTYQLSLLRTSGVPDSGLEPQCSYQ